MRRYAGNDRRTVKNETTIVDEPERVRPWVKATNQVMDVPRGLRPVDDAVGFRQPMRVGRGAVVLGLLADITGRELLERLHQQAGAKRREVPFDLVAGLVRADWTSCDRQHRTCIQ